MAAGVKISLILVEPVVPWRHQLLGVAAARLEEVQHPPRATATGAALGVAIDRPVLIQKTKGLLQDGLRQPQLGMGDREVLHQSRRIGIGLQQTLQNPADRQLQTQVLNRGTLKKGPNRLQTRP